MAEATALVRKLSDAAPPRRAAFFAAAASGFAAKTVDEALCRQDGNITRAGELVAFNMAGYLFVRKHPSGAKSMADAQVFVAAQAAADNEQLAALVSAVSEQLVPIQPFRSAE